MSDSNDTIYEMKLIVGLGNPGDKYVGTRHNLGFSLLDKFLAAKFPASESGEKFWASADKLKAEIGRLENLIFIKPKTYVNNSGIAVLSAVSFYKVKPEDVVVIHDELDLPLGQIKIRLGGAGAGHHGVESVINKLGTDNFIRLRLGIGNLRSLSGERNPQHFDAKAFVLEPFMPNEHSKVKAMLKKGVKALEVLINGGVEKAQNQFNAK